MRAKEGLLEQKVSIQQLTNTTMKFILILLFPLLTMGQMDLTKSSEVNQDFQGFWIAKESSYVNVFLWNEKDGITAFNFSFTQGKVYKQKVLKSIKGLVQSAIIHPDTGWAVNVSYRINGEVIVADYTGDFEGKIVYRKLK